MYKQLLQTLLPVVGGLLFALLFAGEIWGVNALIFTLFLLLTLAVGRAPRTWSFEGRITAVSSLFLAAMVVLHNTGFAKFCLAGCLLLTVGTVHHERVRFLVFGLLLAARSTLIAPLQWVREAFSTGPSGARLLQWRTLQLSVLPLVLFGCFYGLYAAANAQFARLSGRFWTGLFDWFGGMFNGIESLYFLLGLLVTSAALYRSDWPLLRRWAARMSELLPRRSTAVRSSPHLHSPIALRRECDSGVILFTLVNALLLLVNITDLVYVWGPQETMTAYQTKQYVHEGTYLLIASILLAAAIVLYFFRGSLNFYQRNRTLKRLTYGWIAQNAVLTLSVAARNYHYISEFGLAFKRIGVFVFLLSTLTGLFWLYRKVRLRRSAYYLWHRNTWSVFFILVLTATVGWTSVITHYNLSLLAIQRTDWDFLIRELPLRNAYALETALVETVEYPDKARLLQRIENKQVAFERAQAGRTWLSWNWADASVRRSRTAPLHVE